MFAKSWSRDQLMQKAYCTNDNKKKKKEKKHIKIKAVITWSKSMIKLKFKLKKTDEEGDENHTQVIAHYV